MAKEAGNEQFKLKNYIKAIELYTEAIEANPNDHTIFGNRSASYHNLKRFDEALQDGQHAIDLSPDWSKGYQRKAMALHGAGKLEEAYEVYEKGLEIDPSNAQIRQGLEGLGRDMQAKMKAASGGKKGGGGMGDMFGGPEAEAKLRANPRIAKYF